MNQINLPYNSNAEASLLGNLLQYKDAIQDCLDYNLEPNDFYVEKNRHIYQTILTMSGNNEATDIITILDRLEALNLLQKAGGKEYVLSLIEASISSIYTKDYIKLIKSKSISRQIAQAADEIKFDGQNNISIDDILEKAQNRFEEISKGKPVDSILDGSVVFENTSAKIRQLKETGDKITGVKTGYEILNKVTAGFQNGDFIILAARPSVGKTALGINLALNAASSSAGAVAFFSLEMSAVQIGMRMISIETGIPLQRLRIGDIDDAESSKINRAVDVLKNKKIFIDESSVIKVRDIHAKCRKLKNSDTGLNIVFIDYIGLIDGGENSENRQQEVSKISREIKAMARDLNVPVVALSQLRRLPEKTDKKTNQSDGKTYQADKKPRAQDLRESGSLEQDADLVLLIHRPNYRDTSDDQDESTDYDYNVRRDPETIDLIVAKHRNGPSGMEIHLKFDPNITKFYSLGNIKEM